MIWAFRAGFKHLFTGQPARTACSQASPELVEDLIANSKVPVPDTATCWLCLAIVEVTNERPNCDENHV